MDCLTKISECNKIQVVVLHGFNMLPNEMYDFFSKSRHWNDFSWYFPLGNVEFLTKNGDRTRAWFPSGVIERISIALKVGDLGLLDHYSPSGLKEAAFEMVEFLSNLPNQLRNTILVGFSQGAMLTMEVFLELEELPLGIVLLSGTILNMEIWKKNLKLKNGASILQTHGKNDKVLPYNLGLYLNQILRESGQKVELFNFDGKHELNDDVLLIVDEYIQKRSNLFFI
jgi:phospholipase/carboxylesterase